MKYESTILKRLIDTYGVVGNPRYISEIIKEFIVRGKERFPKLFTYQADWLAHIDEFGLNPSYTVSYTGQSIYTPNTLERPVKSAILSGNTLVNLIKVCNVQITSTSSKSLKYVYGGLDTSKSYLLQYRVNQLPELTNTSDSGRVLKFEWYNSNTSKSHLNVYNKDLVVGKNNTQIIEPYIDSVTRTNFGVYCPNYASGILDIDIIIIEYQQGMENWDIPYFEGMQSVKMPVLTTTGKNLFDINNNSRNLSGSVDNFQPLTFEGNQVSVTSKFTCSLQYLVKLKPNTKYTVTVSERNEHNKGSQFRIARYSPTESSFTADWNNLFADIHLNNNKSQSSFVTDATGYIVAALNPKSGNEFLTSTFYNIQLEEGSSATTYEPYKSNILTVNEEVELGSVGEVKDELDLLTGKITQRTDIRPYQESDESDSEVLTDMTNTRYKLAQEVVKTVDLTILDQNGQSVDHLKSFNGGTHVYTTSLEGSLVPSVDISVVTNLEETLKICSLEGNTM